MSRLLFIIFFSFPFLTCWAQEVEIRKSTEVVVFEGESFYLHTVEQGQTLYSIARAYGVGVDAIKEMNNLQNNAISILDVLKIPYMDPQKKQEPFMDEKNYIYHRVNKGETLYSISRQFGMKVRSLIDENMQYEEIALRVGDTIRIPRIKIDERNYTRVEDERVKVNTVGARQTWDVFVPSSTGESPVTPQGTSDMVKYSADALYTLIPDSLRSDDKYVRMALLLPLYAKENFTPKIPIYDSLTLSSGDEKPFRPEILSKTESFLQFYEGVMLGADSLKRAGYTVELYVFDTYYRNNTKMYEIISRINELNPDLILGPVYASELKIVAEQIRNKNTPIIYPLSARGGDDFYMYPNFLQVNISYNSLVDEMINWVIDSKDENANVVTIDLYHDMIGDNAGFVPVKDRITQELQKKYWVNSVKWDAVAENIDTLRFFLQHEQENVIVLPTKEEKDISKILPVISSYADHFKITVLGFPEWQNFTSVDHEIYYKLNVKFFAYSYINNYAEQAKRFAENYRKYFFTEPHTLSNKAFDMMLYFVPLTAKFRDKTLEALPYRDAEEMFSYFRFREVPAPVNTPDTVAMKRGFENKGLYIVNYGRDYHIHISRLTTYDKIRREEESQIFPAYRPDDETPEEEDYGF